MPKAPNRHDAEDAQPGGAGSERLHHRPDLPRHEFIVAIAQIFGFGTLARGHAQQQIEDLPAYFLDASLAVRARSLLWSARADKRKCR